MLSSHLRDADEKKQALHGELAERIAAARAQSGALCAAAERGANARVIETYALQREIESEIRALQAVTAECRRRAGSLRQKLDNTRAALKELGDIANWVAVLENSAEEVKDLAADVANTSHTQV